MTKVQQTRLVPFDIKYKEQIESGIYRVFTRNKQPARIICWDGELYDNEQIVAIIDECVETYSIDGKYNSNKCDEESDFDLFVEILEEEENYTEFESELLNLCKAYDSSKNLVSIVDFIKNGARKLLALANKLNYTPEITENIKEGIIL